MTKQNDPNDKPTKNAPGRELPAEPSESAERPALREDGNQTIDSETLANLDQGEVEAGQGTVEMDDPVSEAETAAGKTVADQAFLAQPKGPSQPQGQETIEMDEPTVDPSTKTVVDTGTNSADDENKTIAMELDATPLDSRKAPTVDMDLERSSERPVGIDQTVEGSAFMTPDQAEGGQTVEMDSPGAADDSPLANQTVESAFLAPDQPAGGGTVDMDSNTAGPASQRTVHDSGRGDKTVELASDADPDPKSQRTVAGDATIANDGNSDKTRKTRVGGDATMQSGMESQSSDRVMVLWSSVDRTVRPGATIQEDGGADDGPRTNLVIQSRALRELKGLEPGASADYELLKTLGEGGMGVVYMARQASIDRTVAIKMLKPKGAQNSKQRGKFLAEAVVTGELDHPNIVPIYDLGVNDAGALFYSMKRVVGTPWDDVLKERSLSANLETLMKVADAIAFAHSRGVLHRDLKPENVMLGDFGEVLVMDWGLAVPIRRSSQCSMGGTPAYMAPEMAAGPFEDVGVGSDVYLLGAILFEILVGKPPHTGADVMKCLFAAAKNEIRPHSKSGELVAIALKAMSTEVVDRYASVADFQTAIRDYQSHSESIILQQRAGKLREQAGAQGDYETFNRAIFGFEESLERWSDNREARHGLAAAKLEFAQLALQRGDFDLGGSMLDLENPEHQDVLAELETGRNERVQKERRLKLARRAVGGLIATVILVAGVAAVMIHGWYREAEDQRGKAVAQTNEAKKQTQLALAAEAEEARQRDLADKAADAARKSELIAIENARLAKIAQEKEAMARMTADSERMAAVLAKEQEATARMAAVTAREQETEARRKAEYEEYIARIGLAAAKINDNAYDIALELLLGCQDEMRDWEWRRLIHLCDQASRNIVTGAPVESVAISQDGTWFVTGGWNGTAAIWDRAGNRTATLQHNCPYVFAVAISPDGQTVATGSGEKGGFIKLWNAENGELLNTLRGHLRDVVNLQFSHDGELLVSASFDKTANIWNVADGKLLQTLRGHNWWVWDAAFSPDAKQVATVSQDGVAYVWDTQSGKRSPPFDGHRGPVYSVAFSADGKSVATGGHDKRVLVWRPAELKPYDYQAAVAGGQGFTTPFRELRGHTAAVRCVQFSEDGQRLLSGGHDNSLRIWGLQSGRSLKTLRGHGKWIRSCVFSSDGQWAFSGGYDETAKLWNIEGYEEERVLRGRVLNGHQDALLGASISADGKFVLTASRDRRAKKWNATTGAEELTFEEGHAYLASNARFFENDARLLTAAVDNTARIWDVASGVQLARLSRTGQRGVACVSPDGKWILTGGQDGQAKLWEVAKAVQANAAAGPQPQLILKGHRRDVAAAVFSPDGKRILTGDISGACLLWDAKSGEIIGRLRAHTKSITEVLFLDEKTAATSSIDKTVAVWDLTNQQEITERSMPHPAAVIAMIATPMGEVITSCDDGWIRIWDADTGKELRKLKLDQACNSLAVSKNRELLTVDAQAAVVKIWDLTSLREVLVEDRSGRVGAFLDMKNNGGVVWSAAFSGDGTRVLTVGGDSARIWDLETARERMSFSPHGAVASAKFSAKGDRVVTASWDNSARIWNAHDGSPLLKLGRESAGNEQAHESNLNSAVFSPDGAQVLTASDDGSAKLWDAETGRVLRTFSGHRDRVLAAEFSRDGLWVLTASSDKTARIFDVQTGRQISLLTGHARGLTKAVFSDDNQMVVSGSEDNTARVWSLTDLAAPQLIAELRGHTAAVTSVDFSPNGKRVLTGCEDFTAKLWDSRTGKEILTLDGHTQEVTDVAFSRDGRNALTSSRDGVAIIWLASELPPAAAHLGAVPLGKRGAAE